MKSKKSEPTIVIRSSKPMETREKLMAFSVAEANPLWNAIHEMLQDEIDDGITMATDVRVADNHGKLAHTVGGIERLKAFQQRLHQARIIAMRIKPE